MGGPKEIQFDRWGSHQGKSLALRHFTRHQHQVLELLKALSNSGIYSYRYLSDTSHTMDSLLPHLSGTMSIKGTTSSHTPKPVKIKSKFRDKKTMRPVLTVSNWSDYHKSAMNWTRLNCLVGAAGNFEMFLIKVAALAFRSNLGLLSGTTEKIDGTVALKKPGPVAHDHNDRFEALTKGEWSARISAYSKQFGSCPRILHDSVSELEKIRRLRNSVAHAFAREIDEAKNPENLQVGLMNRLAPTNLFKKMDILTKCANAIDKQLIENHIGEFEMVLLYHRMQPKFSKKSSVGEKGRLFKQECARNDYVFSVSFSKNLAKYYEKI